MDKIINEISRLTGIKERSVKATVKLLEEGATVPFISRYRKEQTGSLDEVSVREIEKALKTVNELFARMDFISKAITELDKMTPQIAEAIEKAQSMQDLEDIYAPFKPRKRTRAAMAREKGLEPFAKLIMAGQLSDITGAASRFVGKEKAESAEEALQGAKDIIAEWASESVRLRNITRNYYRRNTSIACSPVKGKETEIDNTPYKEYVDFLRPVNRISSHQYLALKRGEREGWLKVKFNDSNPEELADSLLRNFQPRQSTKECLDVISDAVKDSASRLLRPSVENEIFASLKEEADKVAINIFSDNLRQLLLAPPLKGRRILAIDPGYRTGCKVVALDEFGNLLEDSVIYPTPPANEFKKSEETLSSMISRHKLEVAALGNGTASRETERFLKDHNIFPSDKIYVVSENGASVYSASDIARKEFPDKDVTVRGAVSIGRRLIDPLAELVKIDPKSIGVGQYQHDVDQNELKDSLDYTVMSCVNAVGVDVNTASEKLLSYISGIGSVLASNIVKYRAEKGRFRSRNDLKGVPRLGPKAFEQAAGFLRIADGDEPLDNTGIHPESYNIVRKIAGGLGVKVSELPANDKLLNTIDAAALAKEGVGGEETISDIIKELRKPGRDPRLDEDNKAFEAGIDDFSQLRVGMTLPGIVSNITAFGAFVNLGIKENGLIHISQLSRNRVNSVNDVLKLNQRVNVTVIDVDVARKRIGLSLLNQSNQ